MADKAGRRREAVTGRVERPTPPVIGRAFEVAPDVDLSERAVVARPLPSERCGLATVHGLDGVSTAVITPQASTDAGT